MGGGGEGGGRGGGGQPISPHYRSEGRRQGSSAVFGGSTYHGEVRLLFSSKNHFENGEICPLFFQYNNLQQHTHVRNIAIVVLHIHVLLR